MKEQQAAWDKHTGEAGWEGGEGRLANRQVPEGRDMPEKGGITPIMYDDADIHRLRSWPLQTVSVLYGTVYSLFLKGCTTRAYNIESYATMTSALALVPVVATCSHAT